MTEANYALGYENGMIAAKVIALKKIIAVAEVLADFDKHNIERRILINDVIRAALLAVASVEVGRPTTE